MRSGADVSGHARPPLPRPTVRANADSVLCVDFQVGDLHILRGSVRRSRRPGVEDIAVTGSRKRRKTGRTMDYSLEVNSQLWKKLEYSQSSPVHQTDPWGDKISVNEFIKTFFFKECVLLNENPVLFELTFHSNNGRTWHEYQEKEADVETGGELLRNDAINIPVRLPFWRREQLLTHLFVPLCAIFHKLLQAPLKLIEP